MSQPKPLRVLTSKQSTTPGITYLELQYSSAGRIGTLQVPDAEVSDIIQSLRFGFDDLIVREARPEKDF